MIKKSFEQRLKSVRFRPDKIKEVNEHAIRLGINIDALATRSLCGAQLFLDIFAGWSITDILSADLLWYDISEALTNHSDPVDIAEQKFFMAASEAFGNIVQTQFGKRGSVFSDEPINYLEIAGELGFDLINATLNQPQLMNTFESIFSESTNREASVKLFTKYQEAYAIIQNNGRAEMASIQDREQAGMDQFIADLYAKSIGPRLTTNEELNTLVSRRGDINFHAVMDLLERRYEFDIHRMFKDNFGGDRFDWYKNVLGWTDEYCSQIYRTSPADSVDAAVMSLEGAIRNAYSLTPYANFWHHLIEEQWDDLTNDSDQVLYRPEEDCEDGIDHGSTRFESDRIIPGRLFDLVYNIIFKEMEAFIARGTCGDRIDFRISW